MKGLTENPVLSLTVKIKAATKAGRFVLADGDKPAVADTEALGVLRQETKAADEYAAVTVLGTAIVASTAAAIAVGDRVQLGAAAADRGKVEKLSGESYVVGHALTAVPAAGGDLVILLTPT